jgi:sugar (pentulose or hexulose) kinase
MRGLLGLKLLGCVLVTEVISIDSNPVKIRRLKPAAYRASARISLVSSFLPSLFLGYIAPIEVSDASGMNLMNVLTCKWDDALLQACGGSELRAKLGPEPVLGGTVLGHISRWWVERWGFSPGLHFILHWLIVYLTFIIVI